MPEADRQFYAAAYARDDGMRAGTASLPRCSRTTRVSSHCPENTGTFVVSMKLKEETMCPVCISTMALMVAGATSTSGLTALAVKKFYPKNGAKKIVLQPDSKENSL